jgi:hypothetical protein
MRSSGAGDALATLHAGVTALAALDLAAPTQREQLDALLEVHRLVNQLHPLISKPRGHSP